MLWLLPIFLIIHLALSLTVYLLSSDSGATSRRTARELQLFQALEQLDTGKARRLIEDGVSPNARTEDGSSVLHMAVSCRSLMLVDFLISRNVKDNVEDCDGNTPLHLACGNGSLPIVRFLLDHGADVNYRNHRRETPLFYALSGFHNNFSTVLPLLLARGADPRACSGNGQSLLHTAAQYNHKSAIIPLLRLGQPIDARNNAGITPLMEAANSGYLDSLKLLLAHEAKVNLADDDGRTALQYAVAYDPQLAAALLAAGARVNTRDKMGKTPYHYALVYGQPAIRNLLRAHGGRE